MKTWFITGTSSGFGRQLTELLLEHGDRVAATATPRNPRRPQGKAPRVAVDRGPGRHRHPGDPYGRRQTANPAFASDRSTASSTPTPSALR